MFDWSYFDIGQWIIVAIVVIIALVFAVIYLADVYDAMKGDNDDDLPCK